jgi:hypothetical protein
LGETSAMLLSMVSSSEMTERYPFSAPNWQF